MEIPEVHPLTIPRRPIPRRSAAITSELRLVPARLIVGAVLRTAQARSILAAIGNWNCGGFMFGLLSGLTKAAVSVALTPVALVVDVVTLPASAEDYRKGPFDNTAALLKNAGKQVGEAIK